MFEVTTMLHIAICDDDAWMASKVEALAKIFFRTHCVDIKVQSYQSSENLMYDLQDGVYYDLLLLDKRKAKNHEKLAGFRREFTNSEIPEKPVKSRIFGDL